MTAKEYLLQYKHIQREIEDIDRRMAQVTIKNCRDCTFNIYPSQMRMVEEEGSET